MFVSTFWSMTELISTARFTSCGPRAKWYFSSTECGAEVLREVPLAARHPTHRFNRLRGDVVIGILFIVPHGS
jgi:hypothetical protein